MPGTATAVLSVRNMLLQSNGAEAGCAQLRYILINSSVLQCITGFATVETLCRAGERSQLCVSNDASRTWRETVCLGANPSLTPSDPTLLDGTSLAFAGLEEGGFAWLATSVVFIARLNTDGGGTQITESCESTEGLTSSGWGVGS